MGESTAKSGNCHRLTLSDGVSVGSPELIPPRWGCEDSGASAVKRPTPPLTPERRAEIAKCLTPHLRRPQDENEALAAVEAALGSALSMRELGQQRKRCRFKQRPGRPYRWDLRHAGEGLWEVWRRYTGRLPGRRNYRPTGSGVSAFVEFYLCCVQVLEPRLGCGDKQVREIATVRRRRKLADERFERRIRRWCARPKETCDDLRHDPRFLAALLDGHHSAHGDAVRRWHRAFVLSRVFSSPPGEKGSTG
jgi:hypothetical protein